MFEVFGHMQGKKTEVKSVEEVPRPVRGLVQPPSSTEVTQSYSLLTHVQICELSPTGEYVPVPVIHRDNIPTGRETVCDVIHFLRSYLLPLQYSLENFSYLNYKKSGL